MSKHSNFNSTDHTIQPADNVEREVNGVKTETKEESKPEQVVEEKKSVVVEAPKKEEKVVEQPKKEEVVVETPKKEEKVVEQPKKKETKEEEYPAINGYRPNMKLKTKDPVEVSARADYMRSLAALKHQKK